MAVIRVLEAISAGFGVIWQRGDTQDVSDDLARLLVTQRRAEYVSAPATPDDWLVPVMKKTDSADQASVSGGGIQLVTGGEPASTISFLGDSQSVGAFYSTATSSTYEDHYFATWGLGFLGWPLAVASVAATGGHTTAQMLARVDTEVIAYRPGWCNFMGGINDILNGVAEADTKANIAAILDKLRTAGIRTALCSVYPLGSGHAGFTTANNLKILALNRWLREQAQARSLVWVDTWAALIDRTAVAPQAATGMLRDNLHCTAQGARAAGAAWAAAMQPFVRDRGDHVSTQADRYDYDPTSPQLQSNPLFQGTEAAPGAPHTGNEATGIIVERSGGAATTVGSVVARADGFGNNQRVVITSTANDDVIQIRLPSITSRVFGGMTLEGEAHVSFTGARALRSLYLETYFTVNGQSYSARSYNESLTTMSQSDLAIWMRTPRLTLPAGPVTFATMLLRAEFSGAGGVTLDMGRARTTVIA